MFGQRVLIKYTSLLSSPAVTVVVGWLGSNSWIILAMSSTAYQTSVLV